MELSLGDTAPDVQLFDDAGSAVTGATLWANAPVALFFVRHFG